RNKNMGDALGIEFTEVGEDFLSGSMPVDHRTTQPFGILHGGASCVLAETLGSVAAWMCIDPSKSFTVGLDINANHIRSKTEGHVIGMAKPLHIGRTTHVWEINIVDEEGKRVCISRLTVLVKDKAS
ncbi:MAG: hotdog fold thioesterase, partial [Pseudomonadota bacterium]